MIWAWMEEPRVKFLSLPQRERREVKCAWLKRGFEVEGNGYWEVGGFIKLKGRLRESKSSHEGRLVFNFHLDFIHEMKRKIQRGGVQRENAI